MHGRFIPRLAGRRIWFPYTCYERIAPYCTFSSLDVCCVDSLRDRKGAIIVSPHQGEKDAQPNHTPRLLETEEALTVLFCLIDDAYALLNPRARRYESLKRLSDSEVIALALFQQLRGVESERSFLRDAQRFFSHLFPGVAGLHPSSLHRRLRKLRRFLEPLRRDILSEMVGNTETLLVDSTLLSVLHPRQVSQGSGFPGARG